MGTLNPADRYSDAIRLFEKAFSETKEIRRLFGPENLFSERSPAPKPSLTATLDRELFLSYFPSEEPNPKAFVYWESPRLPVKKGQLVGEVRIVNEKDELLAKGDLFAKVEVKGTFLFVLKDSISRILR